MLKFGFRTKLYLVMLSLLVLFGILMFLMVGKIMREALLEENRNRGISIATNLAARAAEPILAIDFLRMKNLVDETTRLSDDIFYIFILGENDETLVHTFKGGFPIELKTANRVADDQKYSIRLLDTGDRLVYDYAVPVLIGNDRFGTIRLGLLRTRVQKAFNRLLGIVFVTTGFVTLVAGFVGAALANTVTRRIKILHESAERALRGDLDTHTSPLLKENCWEIMQCNNTDCVAYGNLYHRCWYLAGTFCAKCIEGDYAKKIDNCRQCEVFKRSAGDEIQSLAECFDYMTLSLNTRLLEQQAAEKTMREQRQLLKTILDATPEFVYLQDRDAVYLAANKAFCRFLGKDEQDIVGKSDFDLFSEERARKNIEETEQVIMSGQPLEKQERIESALGIKWCHVVRMPVRKPDGNISGILWSGRDITALKEMEARLVHSRKMESVGQLAAGIAHEINTPLGVILGYAQVLLEEIPEDDAKHKDLEIINRQCKICRKIVADLLKFSRQTDSISYAFFDINKVIAEVISVVEHTYKLDRVTIQSDVDDLLPCFLGDRDKFKQVFVNLLNNAHDAIGTDGCIYIASRFDPAANKLIISVTDNGAGISKENQARIFDPFFTTKPVDKGTGLGLSVTYAIIQEHGGRITSESPPETAPGCGGERNKGAAFIIHLPAFDHNHLEETL